MISNLSFGYSQKKEFGQRVKGLGQMNLNSSFGILQNSIQICKSRNIEIR
jgi:hypothetical protein